MNSVCNKKVKAERNANFNPKLENTSCNEINPQERRGGEEVFGNQACSAFVKKLGNQAFVILNKIIN